MDPIRAYLTNGTWPTDANEADRVKNRANWFVFYDVILYKRSYARPLLHCVAPEMGQKVLEQLHEEICNSHISGHALAVAAIRTGYYWPSLREDTKSLVRNCDKRLKFAPV